MNEYSNNSYTESSQQEIDFKKIIFMIKRHWYWFALFGVLGFVVAFGYTKVKAPTYWANSSILVPEKSTGLNMDNLFKGLVEKPNNNIYNQIEIIKSYYTINQTLVNLNWRTSWYKKDLFIWQGIYKYEPFDVQENANFVNLTEIPIYITPTSGDNFRVSVDSKFKQHGETISIKFDESGTYGKPFTNKYFNFTLLKKVNSSDEYDDQYYFVFNDLVNQTLTYQSNLSVALKDKKSDIIDCSLVGEEPERIVDFLNEMIRVYTEGKMNFENESQKRSLDFINKQLSGITDSLNTANTKYTEFRSRNSIIDLGEEGKNVMANLKEVESAKVQSQMQLDYFQDLLKYLDSNSDLKQLVAPSVVGIQDASLNALVLQLSDLYNRRQVISFSAKENNPTLVMLDKQLNQVRVQLAENVKNLINNAARTIETQKERQDKITLQLNKLPQKEQQLVHIQRQYELTNEIFTFLQQKRAETNISLAAAMPDVQIIDKARNETVASVGLESKIIMGVGFFVGFALPLAYMLLINFFDDTIKSQDDVEKITKAPILGNIMHNQGGGDFAAYENPKSTIAESFRALRTNLQFMLTGPGGKVISLHSTNPGEGKSFLSINLGGIISMNNKRVLLVGADLRKPRLHKAFDLNNEVGLSTYLIGNSNLEQIIFPTKIINLDIIPAGPIPPNPAELLEKQEMKDLLEMVKNKYDYIIIDNAPTALVTDGQVVSRLSDLNIFVLRYGVSHKHQLGIINQYINKKTIENIALIVNDIKTNSFGNTYYKYYQYEAYQNSYYADDTHNKKGKKKKKNA